MSSIWTGSENCVSGRISSSSKYHTCHFKYGLYVDFLALVRLDACYVLVRRKLSFGNSKHQNEGSLQFDAL